MVGWASRLPFFLGTWQSAGETPAPRALLLLKSHLSGSRRLRVDHEICHERTAPAAVSHKY